MQQPTLTSQNSSSQFKFPQREALRELSLVEDEIIKTCQYLKKLKSNKTEAWVNECIASSNASLQSNNMYPKYDKTVDYYQEFWRTYLLNEMMITKIKEFSGENKLLSNKISDLDNLHKEYHKIQAAKNKKKNRRTAQEIEKSYNCPYSDCAKIYGSEVSLNLHIKLKHSGGNKTERERLARAILSAQDKGEALPEQTLNFPPGYLEQFKEQYLREKERGEQIDNNGGTFDENGLEQMEYNDMDSAQKEEYDRELQEHGAYQEDTSNINTGNSVEFQQKNQ